MTDNFFVRIARTIFGIYALITFLLTLLIAFCCYMIVFAFAKKNDAPFFAHQLVSRNWSRVIFFLWGIRLDIKNKELLDAKQTYVFIANHKSQLDIPSYAISTDHTIRFLSKVELTKLPLLGYVIARLYITVDRKDKEARARSMDNMLQSIRDGISVFICPEGTRNKGTEPLLPFHDGAFRLAIQAQVPLAILVLKNTDKLLSPLRPIELSPGKIICYWCTPISTTGMTEENIPALKEAALKIILECLTG